MDKVGNSSPASTNQSYEPNACEAPRPQVSEPTGTCPDGSLSYDGGVCAASGLKGPPTAAQRYIANFTSEGNKDAVVSPRGNSIEEAKEQLQQALTDATGAAMDYIRAAIDNSGIKSGQKLEFSAQLPNGCKLKVAVTGAMELNDKGQAELTLKASGAIDGKFGVMSAKMEISYSRSTSGQEAFSVGGCLFAGIDHEVPGLLKAESKAGLCATLKDSRDAAPTFQLDAVTKAGVNLKLGDKWNWGHELFESKTMLSKETLSHDLVR